MVPETGDDMLEDWENDLLTNDMDSSTDATAETEEIQDWDSGSLDVPEDDAMPVNDEIQDWNPDALDESMDVAAEESPLNEKDDSVGEVGVEGAENLLVEDDSEDWNPEEFDE